MGKRYKRNKIGREVQKILQKTYVILFMVSGYVVITIHRWVDLREYKELLVMLGITGTLTIAKAIYYCRTKEHRQLILKELKEQIKSEGSLRF